MILYINNIKMDLLSSEIIAQTYEINNIDNPNARSSNATNMFKLPKTANNLKALEFLTVPGNLSTVPYRKNECSLYSDTGECFVYKGWARIEDNGSYFKVYILDGIADFFKVIENKMLSELDLSELVHQKTSAAIIATWEEDKPYRYILADYNGDTGQVNTATGVTPNVNIDYLVPSVNVAWLWNKIWTMFGAAYVGDIFSSYDFTELWMTYPKGQTISGDNDHTIFDSSEYDFISPNSTSFYYAKWLSTDVDELQGNVNNIHMIVEESATYRIRVIGTLHGSRSAADPSQLRSSRIYLSKNTQDVVSPNSTNTNQFVLVGDNIPSGDDFDITVPTVFNLEAGDAICVMIRGGSENLDALMLNNPDDIMQVELFRVDPNTIDFSNAFQDFSINDFVKDIVNRFALTIFKNKYEPVYTFLTLKEQLITAQTVDWSSKFAKKDKETYVKGVYAKRNWFRYVYNDKEASYNDWYIDVNNVNLQATKDIIKSKIYSPERVERKYINETSKVYKLWDKEINENPAPDEETTVTYNPLDKRYYFLRSLYREKTINLISKQLAGQSATVTSYYRENYYKLSFYDIIADYYRPLQQILTRAQLVQVYLNLNDIDILNFDFKKLYYFEQFSAYFLVNKIEDYIPGRLTKVELVRVLFEELAEPPQAIAITKVVTALFKATISFEVAIAVPFITLEYKITGSSTWLSIVFNAIENPFTYSFSGTPHNYTIRLKIGEIYSNEVEIAIPSNTTIIP